MEIPIRSSYRLKPVQLSLAGERTAVYQNPGNYEYNVKSTLGGLRMKSTDVHHTMHCSSCDKKLPFPSDLSNDWVK